MARQVEVQTNFVMGEVDPLLQGRIDLPQYHSGVKRCMNMLVQPQGSLTRRPGTQFIGLLPEEAASAVKLISFTFSLSQSYLLVLTPGEIRFFRNNVLITDINGSGDDFLAVPGLTISVIQKMHHAQKDDSVILVEEDLAPLIVQRGASHSSWTVNPISFTHFPQHNFSPTTDPGTANITPSDTTGNITITSQTNIFTVADEGQFIQLTAFGRLRIVEYIDQKNVRCVAVVPLFDTAQIPAANWEFERGFEDAWSTLRGWPESISFFGGRLWFAGSKSLPATVWGSSIVDNFDFNLGDGFAASAVSTNLSSEKNHVITDIISGRDLQIFTSDGEFYLERAAGEAITPENIRVIPAGTNGAKPHVPVIRIDAGTFFIQHDGGALIELRFTEVEQAYEAVPVSIFSHHLIDNPSDLAVRRATSDDEADRIFLVGENGTITTYALVRSQGVRGASELITEGSYLAVGVVEEEVYTVVKRFINGMDVCFLERFDNTLTMDAAVLEQGEHTQATLVHLEGAEVQILVDDGLEPSQVVSGNQVTFENPSLIGYEVGLKYDVFMETLPVDLREVPSTVRGLKKRIVECGVHLFNSRSLKVNNQEVNFRRFGEDGFNEAIKPFSGIKVVGPFLGYSDEATLVFEETLPLELTILSLDMIIAVGQ